MSRICEKCSCPILEKPMRFSKAERVVLGVIYFGMNGAFIVLVAYQMYVKYF